MCCTNNKSLNTFLSFSLIIVKKTIVFKIISQSLLNWIMNIYNNAMYVPEITCTLRCNISFTRRGRGVTSVRTLVFDNSFIMGAN